MNYRCKFIAIPEYDFTEFGDIVDRSLLEESYGGKIIEDCELGMSFNGTSVDEYNKLTKKLIEHDKRIKELLVFVDNYNSIGVYHNCVVENIEVRVNKSDFRKMTMHNTTTPSYTLDLTLSCESMVVMDSKVFDRNKKLNNILEKIKK